jgi:hypothetical protein
VNVNRFVYREASGGTDSFGAYRADFKLFLRYGSGHVLAVRQNNWITNSAPAAAKATVILRSDKFGEYLAPYMSSVEAEERLSLASRWGATLFAVSPGCTARAPRRSTGRPIRWRAPACSSTSSLHSACS